MQLAKEKIAMLKCPACETNKPSQRRHMEPMGHLSPMADRLDLIDFDEVYVEAIVTVAGLWQDRTKAEVKHRMAQEDEEKPRLACPRPEKD